MYNTWPGARHTLWAQKGVYSMIAILCMNCHCEIPRNF